MENKSLECLSISSLRKKIAKENPYYGIDEIELTDDNIKVMKKRISKLKKMLPSNRGKIEKVDIIEGKYTKDFNIIVIHQSIVTNFIIEIKSIDSLIQSHNQMLKKIKRKPYSLSGKNRIKRMKAVIDSIINGYREHDYIEKSAYYIDKYLSYKKNEKKSVFGFEDEEQIIEENEERLSLVDSYIEFSKKYIKLNITRVIKYIDKCENCNCKYKPLPSHEEGLSICSNCFVQRDIFVIGSTVKENYNKHIESKDHLDVANFVKVLKRFQGQQPVKPPKSLYTKMDEYFISIGRPIGEEIKKLPLNEKGRRGDTDYKMLYEVLSRIGYNEYYEDSTLIGHEYLGWVLPDLSSVENRIIDHYIQTQRVFLNLEKKRTSSLGTQYRLFKHLQLVCGDKYPKDMFKISELLNSIDEHECLWKEMCEGCNNPDIYFIRTR